jgi:chemotaxis signal transduction protein
MSADRLLRFPLGAEVLGLRLEDAQYLAEIDPPAPVPLAPPEIAGLADVRGRIVTVIDLARLVGLPAPSRTRWLALLLAPPRGHLALLLGDTVDVLVTDLARARLEETGEEGSGRRPLRSLLTEEGVLLNLVDPLAIDRLCDHRVRESFRMAG